MMDFKTEQLIERVLLLLQHYRTGSIISMKLDASIAYLQLQLGTNMCPFDLDYDNWGYFVPLSWTKIGVELISIPLVNSYA